MVLDPAQVIVAALGIMIGAPGAGAVLAFTPEPRVRRAGRVLLVVGFLACAAVVVACIWLSGRPSTGIGNGIFLLIAIVPAVFAFIWFALWRGARRHEDARVQ